MHLWSDTTHHLSCNQSILSLRRPQLLPIKTLSKCQQWLTPKTPRCRSISSTVIPFRMPLSERMLNTTFPFACYNSVNPTSVDWLTDRPTCNMSGNSVQGDLIEFSNYDLSSSPRSSSTIYSRPKQMLKPRGVVVARTNNYELTIINSPASLQVPIMIINMDRCSFVVVVWQLLRQWRRLFMLLLLFLLQHYLRGEQHFNVLSVK